MKQYIRTDNETNGKVMVHSSESNRSVKKVLVIGGGGYIGSALVRQLLANNYRVRVLDLFVFGTEPLAAVLGHPYLELLPGDFLQVNNVVRAMHGADAVVHLGAIVGDPACALDKELSISVNLIATRMIAQVAEGLGIRRCVFASTCSVYGASDELLDEQSPLHPLSLYAQSKLASEKVLLEMGSGAFSPVLLRFGTIYGLSGRIRFDLVVNLLAAKAVVDKKVTIFGGDQWRPFVHVEDAALAIVKALEAPDSVVKNQIFNVGSNEQNYTIATVGEIVQQLVPDAELLLMESNSDRRNYRVDFTKIHTRLNFMPRWTLQQGVLQVIDSIKSGLVRDYHETRYSNFSCLQLHQTIQRAFKDAMNSHLMQSRKWVYELINEDAFAGSSIVAN